MTRKGERFVLEPKTKKDTLSRYVMLGLKVKQKVYYVHVGIHLGRDETIQKISSRFFWKKHK